RSLRIREGARTRIGSASEFCSVSSGYGLLLVAALRNRDSDARKVKRAGFGATAVQRIATGWEEREGNGSAHLIRLDRVEVVILTGGAVACEGETPVNCPGHHTA